MYFAIVVAMDQNRGIGKSGDLPWQLSGDLKHFAKVTKTTEDQNRQNAVIMGRKTWESLPSKYRPLPGRLNIVMTRQENYPLSQGVVLANSLDDALKKAQQHNVENAFVIGGGTLYQEAIEHESCRKLFITEVISTFDCDTFFPQIPSQFKRVDDSKMYEEKGIQFRFAEYLV